MSYYHPSAMHPALARHHERMEHRLVADPVLLPTSGTVPALQYHNGPTIPHPKLVALYAGTFWSDRARNDAFLRRLMEDGYLAGLSGQGSGNGAFVGSFDIPVPSSGTTHADRMTTFGGDLPVTSLTDADCRAMIEASFGKYGIPQPDASTIYMLILPDGVKVSFTAGGDSSCNAFCAYHSNTATYRYTVQPANTCSGCNQGDPQVGLQMTEAHEVAETCSDPEGTGWFNDSTGAENADECAWVQERYGDDIVQGYAAQNAAGQWVNTVGGFTPPPPTKVLTTTSFQAIPNTVPVNQPLSLTAHVLAHDDSIPTGDLTFMVDRVALGSGPAPLAAVTWTPQTAGTAAVSASYSGDAGHMQSSVSAVVTVQPATPPPDMRAKFYAWAESAAAWAEAEYPLDRAKAADELALVASQIEQWIGYLRSTP